MKRVLITSAAIIISGVIAVWTSSCSTRQSRESAWDAPTMWYEAEERDNPSYFDAFYDAAPFFPQAGVSRKNLHHWDLLFYATQIHDNALLRAKAIHEQV